MGDIKKLKMSFMFSKVLLLISAGALVVSAAAAAAPKKQEDNEFGDIRHGSDVGIGSGGHSNGIGRASEDLDGAIEGGYGFPSKKGSEIADKIGVVSATKNALLKKDDFFGLNGLGGWIKYIFNPCELIRKIGEHFKLPIDKLFDKIDPKLINSPEAIFEPLAVSFKVMDKVFKNDICRRRFFCQIGAYLKPLHEPLSKFSSSIPSLGNQFKELSRDIFDKDCERDFPECTPFLKKPFRELKEAGVAEKVAEKVAQGI